MDFSRIGRSILVSVLGFFAVGAQALLFRAFLTAFEGNELAIGCFFFSWLMWVAAGAAVSRLVPKRIFHRGLKFELMPLLYPLAFVVQYLLLMQARQFAGVQPYELFPLTRMILVCSLINAPVSLLTGLFFALACRWKNFADNSSVASVYALEAVGCFTGGVFTTILLSLRLPSESVFLFNCVFLAAGVVWASVSVRQRMFTGGVLLAILFMLFANVGGRWAARNNIEEWGRLLPKDEFQGAFTTAHGKYLYGRRGNQFVVAAWETIAEDVQDSEYSAETVAVHLAQHPEAENVLVIGPGSYALCRRFLSMPTIEHVTWIHPDPQYPDELLRVLPPEYRDDTQRFHIVRQPAREFLAGSWGDFDLIVLNLGGSAVLSINSYRTVEFMEVARQALRKDGVLSINLPGAENFVTPQIARIGASQLYTLQMFFNTIVMKPGAETWFFAAVEGALTESPVELAQRLHHLPGGVRLFPPEEMLNLFSASRIALQRKRYETCLTEVPVAELLNTDSHPKSLFYLLQLHADQAGAVGLGSLFQEFHLYGLILCLAGCGIFFVLRLLYRFRSGLGAAPGKTDPEPFDVWVTISAAAFINMSVSIILMVMLQAYYGSLFLHVGLVSSFFMLGLFIGSTVGARTVNAGRSKRMLILFCALLHMLLLVVLLFLQGLLPLWAHALLFLLGGIIGGGYIPAAVGLARNAGADAGQIGSVLEMTDHIGGALGAFLTGIVFVPLLGLVNTVFVMCLVLGLMIALVALQPSRSVKHKNVSIIRPVAYVASGILLFAAVVNILQEAHQRKNSGVPPVGSLAETELGTQPVAARLALQKAESSVPAEHYEPVEVNGRYVVRIKMANGRHGIFFSTADFVPEVYGFNAHIDVGVLLDEESRIMGVWILESRETPSYFSRVRDWLPGLKGKNIFSLASEPVDAVTGATVSSTAVLRSLFMTGEMIRVYIAPTGTVAVRHAEKGDDLSSTLRAFLPYGFFLILTLAVVKGRSRPRWRTRFLFLCLTFILLGWLFNVQFSTEQIRSLLEGELFRGIYTVPLIFSAAVPLVVMLFGNVYCGYLCPFGAMQELINSFVPEKWQITPSKLIWKYARSIKYIILFGGCTLLLLASHNGLTQLDPLVNFFALRMNLPMLLFVTFLLLVSFFCHRFWCRCLCPTGAFLALFNRIRLLPSVSFAVVPKRCDLGVSRRDDHDCICCDRCRMDSGFLRKQGSLTKDIVYLGTAVTAAAVMIWLAANSQELVLAPGTVMQTAEPRPLQSFQDNSLRQDEEVGRVRNVDPAKVRHLIQQRSLSSRPALYAEEFSKELEVDDSVREQKPASPRVERPGE